jgi:hypothetical protein
MSKKGTLSLGRGEQNGLTTNSAIELQKLEHEPEAVEGVDQSVAGDIARHVATNENIYANENMGFDPRNPQPIPLNHRASPPVPKEERDAEIIVFYRYQDQTAEVVFKVPNAWGQMTPSELKSQKIIGGIFSALRRVFPRIQMDKATAK